MEGAGRRAAGRHLAAGAVGQGQRAAGGRGQAGHAVVQVVGEGPGPERAAGETGAVIAAVVAVAQHMLGLQTGRAGGGGGQPVDDIVGEGQVRTVVVRRGQVIARGAERASATGNKSLS